MFDKDAVAKALEWGKAQVPKETPRALVEACKCEPIDPDWPIQSPLHALELMFAWEELTQRERRRSVEEHTNWITHSHHHEYDDLNRLGYAKLYQEGEATKYVSIGWHLAGRYYYDVALIEDLEKRGWPKLKLIDFGAAAWIQACFYRKKGFDVTVVNQGLESDSNRFGRFLAEANGVKGIREFSSDDPAWADASYDIIYAMDVFEHIPPDGEEPGWLKYADQLLETLKPGGLYFANAPFGEGKGTPKPVDSHPVHYTSPISLGEWCIDRGLVQEGYLTKKPLNWKKKAKVQP